MAVIVKLRQTGRKAQASHRVTFSMRASSFGPVPGGSKRACVFGLHLCVMVNMSGQSQESPAPQLMWGGWAGTELLHTILLRETMQEGPGVSDHRSLLKPENHPARQAWAARPLRCCKNSASFCPDVAAWSHDEKMLYWSAVVHSPCIVHVSANFYIIIEVWNKFFTRFVRLSLATDPVVCWYFPSVGAVNKLLKTRIIWA